MNRDQTGLAPRLLRAAQRVLMALVFAGLATAVLDLPVVSTGLAEAADTALPETAAGNAVTATLLDFRSYDTLLELAVLLLAAVAIGALARGETARMRPDDDILTVFSHALVPVMILIAGYLLAAGFDAAGGAFQAGAILAAAGVLLVLAGRRLALDGRAVASRATLAFGLTVFVAAGTASMLVGRAFLDHPQRHGGGVLLLLEIGVAISVARVLLDLFVGVLRLDHGGHAGTGTEREVP